MPKGGCSRTPQQEERSLSSDMVEKQPGKKVSSRIRTGSDPGVARLPAWAALLVPSAGRWCRAPSGASVGGAAVVWGGCGRQHQLPLKDVFVIWQQSAFSTRSMDRSWCLSERPQDPGC